MWLLNLLYFIIACIILVYSGTYLLKSLSKIARFLRITEFAAAFLIMAVATSLPELFVGINSALQKNPAFSLGNIIGANILDSTLIVGIIILVGSKMRESIKIKEKRIGRDAIFMTAILFLPLILFLMGKEISRIDGLILIAVFIIYSFFLLKRKTSKEEVEKVRKKDFFIAIILFAISLICLFISSHFLILNAEALALDFKVPPIIIGLFLISFGTTLPELTFGVKAAQQNRIEMALGDQIGTVIVNSTLILGIVALIYPIQANFMQFLISAVAMIVFAFILATFIESGNRFYVREGVSLILLYALFLIFEMLIKGL